MSEEVSKDLKEMSLSDKDECARNYRDISFLGMETASRRGGELSDEFTRLEVQIATILTAFATLFLSNFANITKEKTFSDIILFGLKLMFSSSLFFLILSLIMGLLHIKRKEQFWDDAMHMKSVRHKKWLSTIKKENAFEQAMSYHEGTAMERGVVIHSPKWTWILQTICLGIAVIQLFALFLIFLFK